MKNVIYKIRNVVNNKFYVGSTVDSRKRFWAHRKALRLGNHDSAYLQRAWDKYGEDRFKFEVVEQFDTKEELYPAEQKWLDEHFGKDHCYNCSPNADTPMRNATPEMRAHQAQKTKEWLERDGHPRQGITLTTEEKSKCTPHNIPKGSDHYRYGKTLDEETRKKIGDTQRGKKKGPRTFTPEGLARAQENMRRNAREQKPADFTAVLVKFPAEVQERYDFSNAVYTGALVRIEGCICSEHGVFSQYAAQFRKGRGCPKCGDAVRAQASKVRMKAAWADPEERAKMMEARKHENIA